MKIRISNITIEVPEELAVQIPFFKALQSYDNFKKEEIININEPRISLSGLVNIIDIFQGKDVPMFKEYMETYEFLGIEYKEPSNLHELETENSMEIEDFYDEKSKMKDFTYYNFNKPLLKDEEIRKKLIKCKYKLGEEYIIERYADMISKFYIEIELPKLPYNTYWKNKVGLQIVKYIEFKTTESGFIMTFNNFTSEIIELEHLTNNDDYWKIFKYNEEKRKLLSIKSNKIVIPIRLSEDNKTPLNLIGASYSNIILNIQLNDVKDLIEGDDNCENIVIENVNLYGEYIFAVDIDFRRYLEINYHENNFRTYRTAGYIVNGKDYFTLKSDYNLHYKDNDILVIIKTNGILINDLKKIGEYYYFRINSEDERNLYFSMIGNYNISVIYKIPNYMRYANAFVGHAFAY